MDVPSRHSAVPVDARSRPSRASFYPGRFAGCRGRLPHGLEPEALQEHRALHRRANALQRRHDGRAYLHRHLRIRHVPYGCARDGRLWRRSDGVRGAGRTVRRLDRRPLRSRDALFISIGGTTLFFALGLTMAPDRVFWFWQLLARHALRYRSTSTWPSFSISSSRMRRPCASWRATPTAAR